MEENRIFDKQESGQEARKKWANCPDLIDRRITRVGLCN